jgi:hypothetical protein
MQRAISPILRNLLTTSALIMLLESKEQRVDLVNSYKAFNKNNDMLIEVMSKIWSLVNEVLLIDKLELEK